MHGFGHPSHDRLRSHVETPETIYPWLSILSGVAELTVGAHLVRHRWHAWRHHHDHDHDGLTRPDSGLARRGVLALGLSAGLLPGPSALLAMLAAIQIHRIGYGIALVLAFTAGLARRSAAPWTRIVPLVSACAIVVEGGTVATRAIVSL